MRTLADPIADVAQYYSGKLALHGATPLGVDWSCQPTQYLRFAQLVRGLELPQAASVNDLGCGYGALLDYLDTTRPGHSTDYVGLDASSDMVTSARQRFRDRPSCRFEVATKPDRNADYCIASGIFNIKLQVSIPAWEALIGDVLRALAHNTRVAFAFNMVSRVTLVENHPEELYACDPHAWQDWCRNELGTKVTLIDAYGMKECTLVCRH